VQTIRGGDPNVSRQFQKDKGEVYGRDESRFTEQAPEPKSETDADDSKAAAYAASCETAMNNTNLDALARGGKLKNIEEVSEGM